MMIQVRAFSRLHFGLMEIHPGQPYCYGGVGIMIDAPSMVVQGRIRSSSDPGPVSCAGDPYWSARTQRVVEIWQGQHPSSDVPIESFRVVEPPQAHVGLGSGTQWACSIAGLLRLAVREEEPASAKGSIWSDLFEDAARLAADAGRGLRSHIGCEGFRRGGLIVDWGQHQSRRTEVYGFPEAWRMVTLCDRSYEGESGGEEASIFASCSAFPNPLRDDMVRMVRDQMIPAIAASDWVAASDAIGRYGEWAGRIFEAKQGGVYRSSAIAERIAHLRKQGVSGVGQSSWGPTVFALARDEDHAQWIARECKNHSSSETLVGIAKAAPPAIHSYERDSSS